MTVTSGVATHGNFINGEWVGSRGGGLFEDRNPADTTDLIGIFQKSTRDDVADAVACLVAASRIRGGEAWVLPEGAIACDARGLRMEIVA